MKKFIFPLLLSGSLILACSCQPKPVEPEPEPEPEVPTEFTARYYNGFFVDALAGAYEYFVENDKLPTSVNVEGILYGKGQYICAACLLLKAIQEDPEHWEDEEVDVPVKMSWGSNEGNNTFEQDSISIEALTWAADKVYNYSVKNGATPNYCNFGTITCPGYGRDSTYTYTYDTPFKDGVKYIGNLISRDYGTALCRAFHFYKHNLKFPEKVSTWGADFLHKVNNCPIDDPLVLSTLQDALKGLSADATPRQKAEAIFKYTRDEWEWENYANTSKGALGTIKAKGGNCCDLTHATLALCRAAGIPARYLHGQCYFLSGVIGHVIPEIWADGRWWICDPSNNNCTWGQPNWKGMQKFNGRYNELPF